jgi:hypothetical protein
MIRDWLILLLFTALAALSISELRKMRRTGVIDDGSDWDWRADDRPGFALHGVLLVAPIVGFIVALFVVLMDVFF